MADILLERLGTRAADLAQAYTVNGRAHRAHERALRDYQANPCEPNAHALVETEAAWDDARDEIVRKAQSVLGTISIVLASAAAGDLIDLRRQAAYVGDAFQAEDAAFNRYARSNCEVAELHQLWQDTRGEIISRARPLADMVKAVTGANGSTSPTEVGT